jgi:hypothetical protein
VQAWDRYAYGSNNPLRYNDPSGHGKSDPRETGGEFYWNFFPSKKPTTRGNSTTTSSNPQHGYVWDPNLNKWIWAIVPDAISISVGGCWKWGFGLEGGGYGDSGFVVNFHTGEVNIINNQGYWGYLGTPQAGSLSGYINYTTYTNVYQNSSLNGYSIWGGGMLTGDAQATVSGAETVGVSLDPDPQTGLYIISESTYIEAGGNLVPNVVDVGVIGGVNKTTIGDSFSEWLSNLWDTIVSHFT